MVWWSGGYVLMMMTIRLGIPSHEGAAATYTAIISYIICLCSIAFSRVANQSLAVDKDAGCSWEVSLQTKSAGNARGGNDAGATCAHLNCTAACIHGYLARHAE
jgi:hypothetical protein